jgi:hypothetical protein
MLTGLHPWTHGVRQPEQALAAGPGGPLFLAQALDETHYAFGVTDGGWLSSEWGFDLGFESFHAEDRDIDAAVELVLQYVRHRAPRGPWLGFLHTFDVHCPYDPPAPYAGTFASPEAEPIEVAGRCGNPHFNSTKPTSGQARFLSDRYDEDVRRVDDALARLFAALDELDLWKNTIVIVTSDHGEEFGEHGRIGHERTLSREALSIPLLVVAPGLAPRVVTEPVGLADLVPTILELCGRADPLLELAREESEKQDESVDFRRDGVSLVPLLRGRADPRAPVFSDLAWQVELLAESDGDATRAFVLGPRLPSEAARAFERRAELLANGYNPRVVDTAAKKDELSGLGYGGER